MSKKTLVVTYLPSGERSNTKKLVDAFLAAVKGKTAVEHLDLLKDLPDVFTTELLGAYVTRNYMGQKLAPAQARAIAKMDRMTAQLKAADVVVVAFPMHNFGLPAIVKGWFDSVMLKGETWDMNASGFVGLLQGKRALILNSSGGAYDGPMAGWEHAVSLAKVEFTFMGYDPIEAICAGGMNANPTQAPEVIASAVAKIKDLVARWYA
jgi:FMN-dependent NADH-azoreductase